MPSRTDSHLQMIVNSSDNNEHHKKRFELESNSFTTIDMTHTMYRSDEDNYNCISFVSMYS